MQYSLVDLLRTDTILTQLAAPDAAAAIHALVAALTASGHADLQFADDVLAREQTFPTGLPTQPIAVAIPHADPVHVHQSAVALATLNAPVAFGLMGTDGSTQVNAQVIFLLAIKEKEKQVEMIKQLMQLIQAPDLLSKLLNTSSPDQALDLIRSTVK